MPLHIQIFTNHDIQIIQKFRYSEIYISVGADPNALNDQGRSPLYRAAYNNHIETVAYLLELGADPRLATTTGELPFDVTSDAKIRTLLTEWDIHVTELRRAERQRRINDALEARLTSQVEREEQARAAIHRELLQVTKDGQVFIFTYPYPYIHIFIIHH